MTTRLAPAPEEKKSKNLFKKLLRSHSQSQHPPTDSTMHEPPAAGVAGRSRASTISKTDGSANHAASQRVPPPTNIKRANTTIGTHKSLSMPSKIHNSNPFTTPTSSGAFDVLGTGQSIAAPRGAAVTTHHPQRQLSNASNSLTSPFASSAGPSSRTPSQMTAHGATTTPALAASLEDEKKNLLPLPIEEPNEHIPEHLKQCNSLLSDLFVIPDGSKDRKLGDGASASVRVVQHKSSHKLYALKKFLMLEKESPKHFYDRASKEYIIAKQLSGNIHLVDTYALMKVQTTQALNRGWGFILEYCKGGDLFSLISRSGWKSSPLSEKLCLFKQITYGVKFMHEQGIVHRDLKPENVLLTEQGICKLTDFGVAEYVHTEPLDFESPIKLGTTFVGSPPYVPPEVVAVKEGSRKTYDPFAPDMWALGMILFCLVYQGTPFQKAQSSDAAYREFHSTYIRFVQEHPSFKMKDVNIGPGSEFKYAKDFQSPHTARLAWKLCDHDPDSRYTMEDLFADNAFLNIESCVDEENADRLDSYNRICDLIFKEPELDTSLSSAKASPNIHSKSMLDFNDIKPAPLSITTALPTPTPPQSSSTNSSPPQSANSLNSPMINSDASASNSLPTLAEVSESLSTSPTTDLSINNLTIDGHTSGNGERFYEADSVIVTPSTDSLLTFSPKSTFNPASPPPRSSMIDELSNGVSPPSPMSALTQQTLSGSHPMNRASSFSSVTSRTSIKSSGSLNGGGRRKKHHHLDVTNIQHRSSFIKKK